MSISDPTNEAFTSPIKSPWVTTGGGFAVGLFTTFGIGALFQSDKHAFALTTFGFVSCLVLVIALATTEMAVIKRADGSTVPIGVWAVSLLAVLSFGLGTIGAVIFFRAEAYTPSLPTKAFYSTTGTAANGGIEPQILVNGDPTDLTADPAHPNKVFVQSDAWIEVRVRGVKDVLNQSAANAGLVTDWLASVQPHSSSEQIRTPSGQY